MMHGLDETSRASTAGVSSVEALSVIKSSALPFICGRTLRMAFSKRAARFRVQMATVISGESGFASGSRVMRCGSGIIFSENHSTHGWKPVTSAVSRTSRGITAGSVNHFGIVSTEFPKLNSGIEIGIHATSNTVIGRHDCHPGF
jgi:hypothetical protein